MEFSKGTDEGHISLNGRWVLDVQFVPSYFN